MKRCWAHVGEMEPCPICAASHRAQRDEDAMIATRRALHNVRARLGRKLGAKHGKRPVTSLPPNRKPGTCLRGHDKVGRRYCQECRRIESGRDLRRPVPCAKCGTLFVREWTAQKRCASHMRDRKGKRQ